MKFTIKELKKIIREEATRILEATPPPKMHRSTRNPEFEDNMKAAFDDNAVEDDDAEAWADEEDLNWEDILGNK